MKIKDLFKKDISRNINGVIKVEQLDDDNITQELEEYVVTDEMIRHLKDFFEAYSRSLEHPTDQIGVWVSGFFGSGKSHFIKILSYLFKNDLYNGKKTIEYFKDKIDDPLLIGEITKAIQSKTVDPILFNIDSIAESNSKQRKYAIVEILMKAFNAHMGYSAEFPWVAEIERNLDKEGLYDKFKNVYKKITGIEWVKDREQILFAKENLVKALSQVKSVSENSIEKEIDKEDENYSMSSDKFAGIIKEYLENLENKRIIFMIDEVGQYIGDNSELMLNLQTVTEDLGRKCMGEAWIIVTSQEAIDKITKEKMVGTDFSKIRGRFTTQLSLTSENTDAVIKKRLLEKKSDKDEFLKGYFNDQSSALKNIVSFSAGTSQMKGYEQAEEFKDVYPFIPYQFNLLQKVFEKIRQIGASGAHLSEGERSMLSAFQEAGKVIRDEEVGKLVSFDKFYKSVESFLRGGIRRTIRKASGNGTLEDIDVDLLKILFMVKYIDEMPSTAENITTLYIHQVDEDKIELRDKVKESLERLESETLISQAGKEYEFLTDEEQDINKQIKSMEVGTEEIIKRIADIVFGNIFDKKKFSYDKHSHFNFNRIVDSIDMSSREYEIGLKVITPLSSEYVKDHNQLAFKYGGDKNQALIILPENDDLRTVTRKIIQTEKYTKKNSSPSQSETIQKILDRKKLELDKDRKRLHQIVETSVNDASFFLNGSQIDSIGSKPSEKIKNLLKKLVQEAYSKLEYIKNHYQKESDLLKILDLNDIDQTSFVEKNPNKLALKEVLEFLERQKVRNIKITLKSIKDRFSKVPYGWGEMDIAGLIVELAVAKKINVEMNREDLTHHSEFLHRITKSQNSEKIVVTLREKVQLEKVNKVRKIGMQLFGKADLSKDEDELFNDLMSSLQKQKEVLKELESHYVNRDYPGRIQVDEFLRKIGEGMDAKKPKELFNWIIESVDKIEKLLENIKPVKSFFNNQVEIYDEARNRLRIFNEDRQDLSEESQEKIEQMSDILDSAEPYSKIRDLRILMEDINSEHEKKINDKKAKVEESITQNVENIRNEYSEIDKEILDRKIDQFEKLRNQVKNADSIIKVKGLQSSLNELNKKITSVLYEKLSNKDGDDKVRESLDTINGSEIASWNKPIRTEQDLDEYIESVREELLNKLKEGKIIKII